MHRVSKGNIFTGEWSMVTKQTQPNRPVNITVNSQWGSSKVEKQICLCLTKSRGWIISIITCGSLGKCTWRSCCCLGCWGYVYVGACHLLSGLSSGIRHPLRALSRSREKVKTSVQQCTYFTVVSECHVMCPTKPVWNKLTILTTFCKSP